jgi:hypothetical protein
LAEGWYDPSTLEKAQKSVSSVGSRDSPTYQRPVLETRTERSQAHGDDDNTGVEEEDDDEYGPMPHYGPLHHGGGPAAGPTIPTMQDLDLRKGNI